MAMVAQPISDEKIKEVRHPSVCVECGKVVVILYKLGLLKLCKDCYETIRNDIRPNV